MRSWGFWGISGFWGLAARDPVFAAFWGGYGGMLCLAHGAPDRSSSSACATGGVSGHFPGLQARIEPGEHPARIAFVDLLPVLRAQRAAGVDIAPGVVVAVAGLRVDAAHPAYHLPSQHHIPDRYHAVQQVDAGLVVDAGVEKDVVQQVLFEQRFLHLLRQAAKTPPVVGHGPAA